jgi:uncharacterized protein (DUF2235 family)
MQLERTMATEETLVAYPDSTKASAAWGEDNTRVERSQSRKAIVLLSDGTGNSASAMFKTNVWRVYEALDLSTQPNNSTTRQIALYDDGVGTSSFRPLALLGGAFGIGLRRNVLDLYRFLCRNYEPGDEIFAFGFSRGAFTIRVTIGLIAKEGILRCETEDALARYSADAYRELRKEFRQTGGLVDFFRRIRDQAVALKRWVARQRPYSTIRKHQLPKGGVAFVGVWDTVAAYGMPIAELTRGIDDWIWPLSMPDYKLSEKVRVARHALALDDERDTFHPLLWDELAEEELVKSGDVPAGRIKQVWFSGMHADVGGGYPDDSLALVPLLWMLKEAEAAGLRFRPEVTDRYEKAANRFAPLHNSRSGVGAYYRLQPRKLSARLDPPDPSTMAMQDPDQKGRGLLKSANIHESVIDRIRNGTDRSAPIVLPAEYKVVSSTLLASVVDETSATDRAVRQEWVWNDVWKRRLTYFATVATTLGLLSLPWTGDQGDSSCVGPECLLVPVITAVGQLLPAFAERWIHAFAQNPGVFLSLCLLVIVLMTISSKLERRIHDGMRELWEQSLELPSAGGPSTAAKKSRGKPDNLIYRLRTSRFYQRTLQLMKWKVVPSVFGLGMLVLFTLAVGAALVRIPIELSNFIPSLCSSGPTAEHSATTKFATSARCAPTGLIVRKGSRYEISMFAVDGWVDSGPRGEGIMTDPTGFRNVSMPWYVRFWAPVLRRSLLDRWFQPLAIIVPAGLGVNHILGLEMKKASDGSFRGEFTATKDGELFLSVNDAVLPLPILLNIFYAPNAGTAELKVEPRQDLSP